MNENITLTPDELGAMVLIVGGVGAMLMDFIHRTRTHKPTKDERRRIVWIDGYPYVEGPKS